MSRSHQYAVPTVIADADWARLMADLERLPVQLHHHTSGSGVDVVHGQSGFMLFRTLPADWGLGRTTVPDGIERWSYFMDAVRPNSPLCDALCALSFRIPGVVLNSDDSPTFLDNAFERYARLCPADAQPTPPRVDEALHSAIVQGLLDVLGFRWIEHSLPSATP